MTFFEQMRAVFFGFIQGLSEFLPISSSGHLVLFRSFFNISDFDLFFILVLHLGTLAAILTYYKKDLREVLKCFQLKPFRFSGPGRLVYLLALSTLPSVLGAFFLAPLVKKSLLHPYWTGWGFILTATCLFFTRWSLKKSKKEKQKISYFDNIKNWNHFSFSTAFLIGLAQVLALFPGMSRSGWTIATALFLGLSQKQAVFFSFLMAIPAILGAVLFELWSEPIQEIPDFPVLCTAFLSAWFFGYLALKLLIRSLQSLYFPFFSFYLWPLGIFIIIKHIL